MMRLFNTRQQQKVALERNGSNQSKRTIMQIAAGMMTMKEGVLTQKDVLNLRGG
jgi:hypothetical protein